MRKFLSLLLALLMLPLPGALAAEKYETLPEHMQMTQSFEHERLGNNVSIDRAWPVTANESVNAELRAAIDQLETQGRACLPAPPAIRRARCWTWAPRCTARAKAGPPS